MSNISSGVFDVRSGTNYKFGAQGPTGPTGSTGPDGITGNTGATGNSVLFIFGFAPNGITVQLQDRTNITLIGVSGSAPIDFSSLIASSPYNVSSITHGSAGSMFISTGAVGLTASFKPLKALNGLSLSYSGDDLIFKGITLTNYALGPTGSVLYAAGNTASCLINNNATPVFLYEVVTSGSTTQDLASGIFSSFLQTKTASGVTNINTIDSSSISTWISNISDSSTNAFYQSGNTWSSNHIYQTGFSKVNGTPFNTGITSINSDIFNTKNAINFGKYKFGSCCYCDGSGEKTCLDYVSQQYCENTLSGSFSSNSCNSRKTIDCSTLGACCINGKCVDTTPDICIKYGGTFNYNLSCSAGTQHC